MSMIDYRRFFPLLPPWQLTGRLRSLTSRFYRTREPVQDGEWTRQRKRQEYRRLAKELRGRHAGSYRGRR